MDKENGNMLMISYIEVIREIKRLQQELINITKEIKIGSIDLGEKKLKEQQLEETKKNYDMQLRTLSILKKNGLRVHEEILKSAEKEIILLFKKRNNLTGQIIQTKSDIAEQECKNEELELQKNITIKTLKFQYSKKEILENSLFENKNNESNSNQLKKVFKDTIKH